MLLSNRVAAANISRRSWDAGKTQEGAGNQRELGQLRKQAGQPGTAFQVQSLLPPTPANQKPRQHIHERSVRLLPAAMVTTTHEYAPALPVCPLLRFLQEARLANTRLPDKE